MATRASSLEDRENIVGKARSGLRGACVTDRSNGAAADDRREQSCRDYT
jgi:hypothetical protein